MSAVISEGSPSLQSIRSDQRLLLNEKIEEDKETEQEAVTGASYWKFLKNNYQFDLVWGGSIVSQTGDWLTEIACLTLLGERGASSYMIALFLISKDFPNSIWAPITGVIADVFDRRKIMLISDLLRMVVVLGYLLIIKIHQDSVFVWALIGVSFLQTSISAFFQPAVMAFIPMIVSSNHLLIAETLLGATWSAVLLLGSGLGGLLSFYFGLSVNFILDSVTYLLSASLLSLLFRFSYNRQKLKETELDSISSADITIEEVENKSEDNRIFSALLLWISMMKSALVYLKNQKYILIICLVKFFGTLLWYSFDMALINFSQKHFIMGEGGQLSLSILYATGGIGSGLGPFLATVLMPDTSKTNLIALIIGWWCLSAGIFFSAFVPNIVLLCITSAIKSAGTALLWTFSDVIKDKLVPESILGRVSAFELALVPFGTVISKLGASWALESNISPFHISFFVGLLGFSFSLVWTFVYLKIIKQSVLK